MFKVESIQFKKALKTRLTLNYFKIFLTILLLYHASFCTPNNVIELMPPASFSNIFFIAIQANREQINEF